MNVPVVISTGPDRGHWVRDCLNSIHVPNVTLCKSQAGGELGAIRMVYEGTRWARFLLLQDSVVVLDQRLFDLVDEVNGPLLVAPRPCMYLAVYERAVLDELDIPDVPAGQDRELAIEHETAFCDSYVRQAEQMGFDVPVLFPELTDANAAGQVHHNGRLNLVLENDFLRKYKGTWR